MGKWLGEVRRLVGNIYKVEKINVHIKIHTDTYADKFIHIYIYVYILECPENVY